MSSTNAPALAAAPPPPPGAPAEVLPGSYGPAEGKQPSAAGSVLETISTACEIVVDVPATMAGGPKRLESDTDVAYSRFVHWAQAPLRDERRSYRGTARWAGVDESTIRAQAEAGDWGTRAIDFDRKRLINTQRAAGELQVSTAASHLAAAQALTDQAHQALGLAQDALDQGLTGDWVDTAGQVSRLLERAQKIARLALGQSESNVSIQVSSSVAGPKLDLSLLSRLELIVYGGAGVLARLADPELSVADRQRARTEADHFIGEIRVASMQGESTKLVA